MAEMLTWSSLDTCPCPWIIPATVPYVNKFKEKKDHVSNIDTIFTVLELSPLIIARQRENTSMYQWIFVVFAANYVTVISTDSQLQHVLPDQSAYWDHTRLLLDTQVTDCKLARESEGCRNNTDNIPSQDYTAPEDDQKLITQMKIWSSHLLDNLSNCLMNLKNSGDSTGFEPMISAMPVQCFREHCTGIEFFRHEFFRFMRQLLKSVNCPASARIISSFDFKERTSYIHFFKAYLSTLTESKYTHYVYYFYYHQNIEKACIYF